MSQAEYIARVKLEQRVEELEVRLKAIEDLVTEALATPTAETQKTRKAG